MGITEFSVGGGILCPELLNVGLVEFEVCERVRCSLKDLGGEEPAEWSSPKPRKRNPVAIMQACDNAAMASSGEDRASADAWTMSRSLEGPRGSCAMGGERTACPMTAPASRTHSLVGMTISRPRHQFINH